MLKRTEGIVLKSFPLGEADLIVTYLTADFGVMSAFAKSPRKTKSRFGSSLEPLTYSKIAFFGKEDARLPRLTQSDIIRPFQGLREDAARFERLAGLLRLTLDLLPENEPNRNAFLLLREVLEIMEGGGDSIYELLYRIRLIRLAGLSPRLESCMKCGSAAASLNGSLRFFLSHGAIICGKCSAGGPMALSVAAPDSVILISQGSVRLYESLLGWDLSKVSRIRASAGMLSELNRLLDVHIRYRLAKRGSPEASK